jgi:hypothetical protein
VPVTTCPRPPDPEPETYGPVDPSDGQCPDGWVLYEDTVCSNPGAPEDAGNSCTTTTGPCYRHCRTDEDCGGDHPHCNTMGLLAGGDYHCNGTLTVCGRSDYDECR